MHIYTEISKRVKRNYKNLINYLGSTGNDVYPENYSDGGPEPTGGIPEINSKSTVMAQVMINRTRPQPCDMEVDLYQLEPESKRNPPPEDSTGYICDTRYIL